MSSIFLGNMCRLRPKLPLKSVANFILLIFGMVKRFETFLHCFKCQNQHIPDIWKSYISCINCLQFSKCNIYIYYWDYKSFHGPLDHNNALQLANRPYYESQFNRVKQAGYTSIHYRPQRSWGKVMFLQVCEILFTGGEYLTMYTPWTMYTPLDQEHPPWTRYTPRTRYPPGPGTPLGTGTLPQTRYIPRNRYTLQTRYILLGPSTPPWDQVHPQPGMPSRPGTPPGTREIRSTRGRYASYWNAILLRFDCLHFAI